MSEVNIEKQLNAIYQLMENNLPPETINRNERIWNDGFYRGKLFAMECVVNSLTGKSGDEIKDGADV